MGDIGCVACTRLFNDNAFLVVCRNCGKEFHGLLEFQAHFPDFNFASKTLFCEEFPNLDQLDDDIKAEPDVNLDIRGDERDSLKTELNEEDDDESFEHLMEGSDDEEDDDDDVEVMKSTSEKERRKKNRSKVYRCKVCRKLIPLAERETHIASMHRCDFCFQTILDVKLQTHKRRAHWNQLHDTQRAICDICGKSYRNRKQLSKHYRSNHCSDFKFHHCKICDYKSPDSYKVKLHTRLRHDENKKKEFICLACGYRSALKFTLKTHVVKRHGEKAWENWLNHDWSNHDWDKHQFEEKPTKEKKKEISNERVICDSCGKSFANQHNYKFHYKRKHSTDAKVFHCQVCDYFSHDSFKVRQHTRLRHETNAKKEFVCHVCGKEMTLKGNLKAHIKSVHGEQFWETWQRDVRQPVVPSQSQSDSLANSSSKPVPPDFQTVQVTIPFHSMGNVGTVVNDITVTSQAQ